MSGKRKHILLITSGFPFGNTERGFLTTEFHHLQEHFDISILSIGSHEALRYPFPEEISLERYHYPALRKTPLRLLGNLLRPRILREAWQAARGQSPRLALARYKQILAYWCNAQSIQERIEHYVREGKADLIYTYWCTEATLAGCLVKEKYPHIPLLTRFHGHDLFQARKATNYQPARAFIAQRADALVFACRAAQDYFLENWGTHVAGKSLLCYLGSAPAPQPAKAPSETLRLVSCSNLVPLKRVHCIIDAISRLGDTPVRWDHFGDGPERLRLEQLAKDTFGEHVAWKFHGHVPNEQLQRHYLQLDPDLFVTTSATEGGVPVSIQEAFAMGIAAIGTDVGGIPDLVIDRRTGYLIPGQDPAEELAQAIRDYLDTPVSKKQALSQGAKALWAEHFDANANALAFLEVLRGLMGS